VSLDARLPRLVRDDVRKDVRDVTRHRDEAVVRVRVDRHRRRADVRDEPVDEAVAIGVGVRPGGQKPRRAVEQRGARVLGAP
jgi:hypothetical protein